MQLKHNKIKNTGLLYEFLVRQITTDVLNNKESKALGILKKYYTGTEISKEFRIYNSLNSAKNLSESKANVLLSTALEAYKKLDKNKVKSDKYNLISEIKKNYNIDDFFKSKVDNYKLFGSIYLLFENENNPNINKLVDYKVTILEHISKPKEQNDDLVLEEFMKYDKGTRNLVYKLMIDKFNKNYVDLLPKQKSLLKEYINNISTNENTRKYINREITLLKEELSTKIKKVEDQARKIKLEEVMSFMVEIPENKTVSDKDMNNLMYYYELINELK